MLKRTFSGMILLLIVSSIWIARGLTGLNVNSGGETTWKEERIGGVPLSLKPINVTFRLLAVERYFSYSNGTNYVMRSAQHFIGMLLNTNDPKIGHFVPLIKNWQNMTWGSYRYTSYLHLLSCDPGAVTGNPYYRGVANKTNILNEIQNFLGATGSGESNNLTVRIFYYCDHSAKKRAPTGQTTFPVWENYLLVGDNSTNPDEIINATELDQALLSGDLQNNNCTVVIFDSCESGGFTSPANSLCYLCYGIARPGRTILTACSNDEYAHGWTDKDWSFFTGHPLAYYWSGTMFGALGIRGAVYEASKAWNSSKFATFDIDKDGWLTAKEIFDFANSTTITYTGVEYSQGHINTAQTPQFYGGVTSGDVPIAMYWPNVTTVVVPLLQQQGRWHEEVVPNWFKHNPPPCSGSRGEPCASSNSMFKGDAGRTGYFNPQILHGPLYAPTITDESTLLWNVSLSKLLLSSPVVDENVAFFTSSNPPEPTNLYALELKTGNVLWTFTTEGESFSSLALCEGKIFFGTKNTSDVTRGTLYALDEDAGTLIWNLSIGGHMSSPAISEGMLIFTTTITDATSSAWALNVTTGVPIWNLTLFDRSIASPTVFEGRVFFATYEGNITAIEQFTGHQIWSTLIPNRIFSTPAAAHGLLFIGTLGNPAPPGVLALNIASGFQYWNTPFPAPIYSSPSVDLDRGTVIACSQDGTIRALSEISGSIIWENVIGPVNMSSPAISKWRIIYTGSLDSRIYSLNERTGDVLGYFDTGSPIESSPAGYGPHVLIGSLGGRFLCFGPEFPVHDVAVRGVEPSQTTVKIGQIIDAQVNVTNHGNVPETFNLICAYNNTDVWQPPTYLTPTMFNNDAVTLSPGENATLTHQLNTTAMGIGAYTLIAFVPQVAYEGDTSDNTFMSVELRIIIPGDVNGDNQVNILDCIILANHFGHINGNGHIPGTKEWKDCLNSDINSDSRVNILDCIILAGHFGQKSP